MTTTPTTTMTTPTTTMTIPQHHPTPPLKLPLDVARCAGGDDRLCDTCSRLALGHADGRVWLYPDPAITDGRCDFFIPTHNSNE